MHIVMMGTGPYAVPTFRALFGTSHEVVALLTRPVRLGPGRRKPPPNPMRQLAVERRTPVYDPADVNAASAQQTLRDLRPELLIVCDYGQILAPETLAIAPHGGFNLHASLLPAYRGAAPINWAIYHGETETGNTVIHMTPRIDAGPSVAQQTIAIGPDETAAQLEPRLADAGAELVLKAIAGLEDGKLEALAQDPGRITRAPKLKKTDGQVDWLRTAEQIRCQVRAFQPWPKTYTYWLRDSGEPLRLILSRVSVVESSHDVAVGVVVEAADGRLIVNTGDGGLLFHQLQPAGKKTIAAEEFLRGYPVAAGNCFGNPPSV